MIAVRALPYDYPFEPGATALVVIDMQRDFIERGGFGDALGNDVERLAAIVPAVVALLGLFRDKGWPIIHTRECHRADLSDCPPSKRQRGNPALRIGEEGPMGRLLVRGSPGADLVAACAALPGETVIDKPGKGMFWKTDIARVMQEKDISKLVFAGVTTEVCVQTSMREANDRGFDCLLIKEATESYFPEFKAATLAMITAQGGIVGWTANMSALLAAVG
jgi:nicotinamidase-related amidase